MEFIGSCNWEFQEPSFSNGWVQGLKCCQQWLGPGTQMLLSRLCFSWVLVLFSQRLKVLKWLPVGSSLPPHGLIHRANLRMTNLPKSHVCPGPMLSTMEVRYHHLPGLGQVPAPGCMSGWWGQLVTVIASLAGTTWSHEGRFPERGDARQPANRSNGLYRPFQPGYSLCLRTLDVSNIPTQTF